MFEVDGATPVIGERGAVTLLDAFEGRRMLIAYYFMWHAGHPAPEQCVGCDQRTLNSVGSVASHDDLKALAVERQLGLMHGLAVSVRPHFDAIKVVSGRFQDEYGEPFLPEQPATARASLSRGEAATCNRVAPGGTSDAP
jgi:predicted dithiol-disulfide oxidoreductase (DUF899 family)